MDDWLEYLLKGIPIVTGAIMALSAIAGFFLQRKKTDEEFWQHRVTVLERDVASRDSLIARLRSRIRQKKSYDPDMDDEAEISATAPEPTTTEAAKKPEGG